MVTDLATRTCSPGLAGLPTGEVLPEAFFLAIRSTAGHLCKIYWFVRPSFTASNAQSRVIRRLAGISVLEMPIVWLRICRLVYLLRNSKLLVGCQVTVHTFRIIYNLMCLIWSSSDLN